ncbi:beta-ketoacyl-[acyl-carrier-protein] synthase family protein [Longispora sp. K20-0274]|uniref:beta-ketoacyl-[acyl-carrier-protein] synthase family protein n=1 Tax=Longispora sp. K20-0274 TaxID=3088255 RepID=UPI00399BB3F0
MSRAGTVTGIGLVTPLGTTVEGFWKGLCDGPSGLGAPDGRGGPLLDVAGLAPAVEPLDLLPPKGAVSVDRFVLLAVAAADAALADAGIVVGRDVAPDRVAVIVSSAGGGMATYEEQALGFAARGRVAVSPYLLPGMMMNQAAARIAIRFGVQGFSTAISSACAGGGQAVGEALRLLRAGEADVVLCGGTEAPFAATTVAGFANAGTLAHGWADPTEASRPFDARRNGLVLSEGAGMLVLERTAHADARRAAGYADVLGWGATTDAHHPTMPRPDGAGAAACMRRALADAGLPLAAVGYLNAHATGTRLGDLAEARAVGDVFGATGPAVSSTKGATGHLLGAAGAVEAAATALTLGRGLLPPTRNLDDPDPGCALDHVRGEPRPTRVEFAMSNSFAFGGHNVSLVLGLPGTREGRHAH